MVYYSALHYAAKAAKSAEAAADSATQVLEWSGKIVQVGFDGTLANGVLTFKHAPGGVEVPYNLQDDFEYELDLAFASTADLPTNTQMVIKNGNDTIRFVSALHRDATTNATVADMDAVMRFNSNTGYRWLFKAAYKITPSGDKVFLLYPVIASEEVVNSKITNCITEIPQDIKLEFTGSDMILKAGSKVTFGDGTSITITVDKNVPFTITSADKYVVCYTKYGNSLTYNRLGSQTASGTTTPTSGYWVYYNTTDKKVYDINNGVNVGELSLPLCIFSSDASSIISIDQVFNGFGYIGSTIFALPGVKGLIPNGRNVDGSLKNVEFTVDNVITHTTPNANMTNNVVTLRASQLNTPSRTDYVYEAEKNRNLWQGGSASDMSLGDIKTDSSAKITSFTPKLPFRAVDQNDFNRLDEEVTTLDAQNVKLTGNQTIGDVKTFIKGTAPIKVSRGDATYGEIMFIKKDGTRTGGVRNIQEPQGNTTMIYVASDDGQSIKGGINIFFDGTTAKTSVPTPPASDNSNQAATTAWVNNALRGSLMAYAGATAPTGWLKCDGSAVSRTTYSALFAIIGTTYGAGNGSTTFNLPNFVNRTFWGGTGAGQALSQTLPNIKGTFKNGSKNELGLSGAMYYAGTNTSDGFSGRVDGGNDANWTTGDSVFDASKSNSVYQDGAVVRPNVIQTLICIKY